MSVPPGQPTDPGPDQLALGADEPSRPTYRERRARKMNATALLEQRKLCAQSYEERAAVLRDLDGQVERVRLTYRNGGQTAGRLTTKDYGHCVDILLDNHGGMPLEQVVAIEAMHGTRYSIVKRFPESTAIGGEAR